MVSFGGQSHEYIEHFYSDKQNLVDFFSFLFFLQRSRELLNVSHNSGMSSSENL